MTPPDRERLSDLLARLEQERQDADRAYNEALTGLDRALATAPEDYPHPPPVYDASQLHAANQAWKILPSGPPTLDGSLGGRLRAFVWRLVGPALETQQQFNAALVDHLNRNVAAHTEAERATASVIALMRDQTEALIRFQGHLIRYLQTLTLYVDTRDRAWAGDARVVNAGLSALSDDWLKRWESLRAREERLLGRVAAVDDSVHGALDDVRATASLSQQTALTLKREVERLLAAVPIGHADSTSQDAGPAAALAALPAPDLDAYKYLGFEDAFRGSQDEIRRRLEEYVPLFEGQSDVLDLGCGRGEFLDLLRARGIRARGLDLNHEMVEESRRRGLEVDEGDALGYLQGLPDASLGGLFAAQVVEHLQPDYLMRLLETASHKMRPGAVVVLETINPACWLAFFESYIRDLTHVRPLHPETLQYLLRVSGFIDVSIAFKAPIPPSARLQAVPPPADALPYVADLVETFNDNMGKLNARMFTFQDYAAIGHKRHA